MKRIIAASCLVLLGACGAGVQNTRSSSIYEVDDGVNPARRVTVSHEGHGNAASIGLPVGVGASAPGMVAGFGGYGQPVMGGGNMCSIHPDYCGTTVTTPVSTNSDLERRVGKNEDGIARNGRNIKRLAGSHRVLVREGRRTNSRVSELEKRQEVVLRIQGRAYKLDRTQCEYLQREPEVIADEELRSKATNACNEILGASAAGEEGVSQ